MTVINSNQYIPKLQFQTNLRVWYLKRFIYTRRQKLSTTNFVSIFSEHGYVIVNKAYY